MSNASPVFVGRHWVASNEQRGFRRSPRRSPPAPAARVSTPMPEQRGSPSSKGHPLDEDADDAECSKCSPVFHGGPLTSPIGRIEEKVDDPLQMKEGFSMLRASAWLSHNIGSQASYRLASPMELAFKQKSPRLDLTKDQHPDAIEEECDVLEAIGSRLEDEEELAKESREKARSSKVQSSLVDACPPCQEDDDFVVSAEGISYAPSAALSRGKANMISGTPQPFSLHSDSVPSSVAANQRSGGLQSVKARHDKDVGGCCLPTEGTEEDRRDQHWHMASKLGFAGFGCHCSIASARGATSCIDIFGKEQFRRWHNETYIIPVTRDNSSPSLMNAVQTSIHQKIWGLKAPATDTLGGQDRYGRKYVIPKWTLDGHEVCREAWQLVVGGSSKKHSSIYSMVCGGYGPADMVARKSAKILLEKLSTRTDAKGRRDSERRGFAANWWKDYFLLCDFLPNEERIQIRGPPYETLHKSVYKPAAEQAGLYLGKKQWKECSAEGLKLVAALLPGADPNKLKASRSARHSKFPECQNCQDRRKAWMDACQNLSSDKELVESLYAELLEHQKEWSSDRATALALRRSVFSRESRGIYECDDKCGSFWLALPVDWLGREGKSTAEYRFRFSIQGNVICGLEGVLRFAMVPKFVKTGGNFGLTNLLMTIWRAKEAGRLTDNVKTMYRHTVRTCNAQNAHRQLSM